jgi:hypothetical protein
MARTISDILGCPSPTNTREPNDFYRTPGECTQALIAHRLGRRIKMISMIPEDVPEGRRMGHVSFADDRWAGGCRRAAGN